MRLLIKITWHAYMYNVNRKIPKEYYGTSPIHQVHMLYGRKYQNYTIDCIDCRYFATYIFFRPILVLQVAIHRSNPIIIATV